MNEKNRRVWGQRRTARLKPGALHRRPGRAFEAMHAGCHEQNGRSALRAEPRDVHREFCAVGRALRRVDDRLQMCVDSARGAYEALASR